MIKAYQPQIDRAIRNYFNTVADNVQRHGIHAAQGMIHGDVILNGLSSVIKNLYKDAVKQAIGKNVISSTEIKSAAYLRSIPNVHSYIMIPDGIKAFPTWLQLVYEFLDRYLLSEVVLPISQTTIAQVDRMLSKALDEGWGTAQMVNELKESELPAWRARLIARTETVRATNIAQMIQAAQSPYKMKKQWIAVDDNRTRPTHGHAVGVDGEVRDLTEAFSNGGQFPGDPNLDAEEVCNCRCTLGYFADRDEDGNLVPRDPKQEIDLSKLLNANGI